MRAKTVVLARNLYNIGGIVVGILNPYMLNPTAWNWGNYTGFFWAALAFCCIVYTYFRVPEPRGRTFAELDLLFERKVSARKFATTEVDVFDETVDGSVVSNMKDGMVAQHSEKTMEGGHKAFGG